MPLTDKEKRSITSPQSFSSKQRKTTKFRTKKKIQWILQDMQFLIKNNSEISEIFGIDVFKNTVISEFSESKKMDKDTIYEDKPSSNDPDLL